MYIYIPNFDENKVTYVMTVADDDSENENALKQCRIDCDNDIEQLNRIYNENSAKWVDDIFNEIIKE